MRSDVIDDSRRGNLSLFQALDTQGMRIQKSL